MKFHLILTCAEWKLYVSLFCYSMVERYFYLTIAFLRILDMLFFPSRLWNVFLSIKLHLLNVAVWPLRLMLEKGFYFLCNYFFNKYLVFEHCSIKLLNEQMDLPISCPESPRIIGIISSLSIRKIRGQLATGYLFRWSYRD